MMTLVWSTFYRMEGCHCTLAPWPPPATWLDRDEFPGRFLAGGHRMSVIRYEGTLLWIVAPQSDSVFPGAKERRSSTYDEDR